MNKRELIAPCGLDCFNCEMYEDNISEQMAAMMSKAFGLKQEDVACRGCRVEKQNKYVNIPCATYNCAQEKSVEFCFECDTFPCANLMPARDGAEKYPHNFKLYNLSRMKLNGVDAWIEESTEIRQKYFKGSFVVGRGPVIRD